MSPGTSATSATPRPPRNPDRQPHSRETLLDRRGNLARAARVGLAVHALEGVIHHAVEPARDEQVETEPQIEGERRAAAPGKLRRREIVGPERDGGSRAQVVGGPRAYAHRAERLRLELWVGGAPDHPDLEARVRRHVVAEPEGEFGRLVPEFDLWLSYDVASYASLEVGVRSEEHTSELQS